MNLRLVREDDYDPDWDDGAVRPPAPGEYATHPQVSRDAAVSRGRDPQRRRRERSAGGRVAWTFLIALLLVSSGAAVYFAQRSGAFDGILAALQSAPAPVADVVPVATEAPAAVPQAPAPAPASEIARPPIPDVQGLVILVRNAVMALHQANVTGNYTVLREMAAPSFQQANSPANLSEAFADLRGRTLPLDVVTVANPSLYAPPAFTDDGLLRLAGFFPVDAGRINFDALFQMIDGHWRLFGIGVFPAEPPAGEAAPEAKPTQARLADPTKLPEPAAMVSLIRGTVLALNQANMTGNYSVLREMAAPGFREANSLAQLGTIFAALRERQLDLGPVAVIDPRLFKPAAIDPQGFLRLTGYFPSQPEQVNFDLAFQVSDGQWRLFGIGLNTSREAAPDAAGAPAQPPSGAAPADAPPPADGGASVAPASGKSTAVPPSPRLRPHS